MQTLQTVLTKKMSFGYDGWISSHDCTDEKTEVCIFSPSGMTVVVHDALDDDFNHIGILKS